MFQANNKDTRMTSILHLLLVFLFLEFHNYFEDVFVCWVRTRLSKFFEIGQSKN